MKKYSYNLYDDCSGCNHFSGVVKPKFDLKIEIVYKIKATPKAPKGINKYLLKVMSEAIRLENNI